MQIEDIYRNFPSLATERLLLRKITMDDLNDIYYYGSNANVAKYVSWPKHETHTDSKEFIEMTLYQYENNLISPWGIEHREDQKLIGTIGFVSWNPDHQIAEIGYALSEDYWNKGLITEAAKRILTFGFEEMNLVRIQAKCIAANIGSARVMEKAGMTFEGVMRKALFHNDQHWDIKLYAILKEDFLSLYE
ncbi:GNAT family N-acetyltransferase [Gracilibacillus alcaliphilus]|uniref:GNAT family N-acetyltransferase n=1 Tax=Gracilibacillus alcaliphilus TaxID=1401441 RepID=UPI00195C8B2D|nr:GNAT family protein [Gracilibacillus alcaliphilus]MBM7676317.1 ribosomal-protein-alanine N-acetyltransferase [Gracilibacillus alcaliphilus]